LLTNICLLSSSSLFLSHFDSCLNATATTNPYKDAIAITTDVPYYVNDYPLDLNPYIKWGYNSKLSCVNMYTQGLLVWPENQPKKRQWVINRTMLSYCTQYLHPDGHRESAYQVFCATDDANERPVYLKGLLPLWLMTYDECAVECSRRNMFVPCYRDRNIGMDNLTEVVLQRWPVETNMRLWNAWYPYDVFYGYGSYTPYVHIALNVPSRPGFVTAAYCPESNFLYYTPSYTRESAVVYSVRNYRGDYNVEYGRGRDPATDMAICICSPAP
jgi:hypothetical protein